MELSHVVWAVLAELSKFSCLGLEAAARLEAAIVGWALREACRLVISGMMLLLSLAADLSVWAWWLVPGKTSPHKPE